MKFSISTECLKELKEALKTKCEAIRFGSEYCEKKIPSLKELEEAYVLIQEAKKEFIYVSQRATDKIFELLISHLEFLSGVSSGKIKIVVNDLGMLEVIKRFPNLFCALGRQLVAIPARARPKMSEILKKEEGLLMGIAAQKIFTKTNLDYRLTEDFFLKYGIRDVDIDWLPECFGELAKIKKRGISPSIHAHLSIVTFSKHCHTSRFLGLDSQTNCPHPCLSKAFLLEQDLLGKLYLRGNTVYTLKEPTAKDFKILKKIKPSEIVLMSSILTGLTNSQEFDNTISKYSFWLS